MSSYSRFRGTHRLASAEAARIVMQILRETPETRRHDRDALAALVQEVEASGVGAPSKEDPNGGGYRQVLAVLTGVLLRLAGANDDAVRGAVVGRDGGDLERLVQAILARMGQLAEQGEPVRRLEASVGAELSSVVGVTSDGLRQFGALAEEDEDLPNEALAYLEELADERVRRIARNVGRPNPPSRAVDIVEILDSASASGVRERGDAETKNEDALAAMTTLAIAEGVALRISADALESARAAGARAELIRAFASTLERYFRAHDD